MTTVESLPPSFTSDDVDATRIFLTALGGGPVGVRPFSDIGFSAEIRCFSDWPISLYVGFYANGCHIDPIADRDNLTIAFADTGQYCYIDGIGPIVADPEHGVVLNSSRASRAWCSEKTSICCLQIAVADLNKTLESVLDKPLTRPVEIRASFRVDGDFGKTLQSIVGIMQNGLSDGGVLLKAPHTLRLLREAAVLAVIEGLPHSHTEQMLRSNRLPAPWQIRRSVELIEAADGQVTIQELAEATGTGVRNLQLAFRRYLDSTPVDYMRAVRLAKARKALLEANSTFSLDQIARRYGFHNSGRFSALYRKTYGERPSETRRRR